MSVKLGEYVLEKRIGKGGMGQVFRARQESLDRLVAVKVLPKELAKDDTFFARFEREAKSAASLIHPNVIQIYSYGVEKDVPYFAMEYVEGEDLAAKLKQGQKFSIKESISVRIDRLSRIDFSISVGVHEEVRIGVRIIDNGYSNDSSCVGLNLCVQGFFKGLNLGFDRFGSVSISVVIRG